MIKKSVNINIGGEEREAKFTIGALEELEAMLPSHNVFSLMQKEQWSVTEIIACLYCSGICGLVVSDRGPFDEILTALEDKEEEAEGK